MSASVIRTLEKRGLVEVFAREVRRDPLSHIEQEQMELVTLNEEQQRALDQIVSKMDERKYSTFLLHGVTGSGKTEIYIRAMREATRRGMSALMLVPEIALTPVFSRRLARDLRRPRGDTPFEPRRRRAHGRMAAHKRGRSPRRDRHPLGGICAA